MCNIIVHPIRIEISNVLEIANTGRQASAGKNEESMLQRQYSITQATAVPLRTVTVFPRSRLPSNRPTGSIFR